MDVAHELLFVGAVLIFAGILAGILSSRIGAPLLLAFLGLGMVAGQDGLGLRVEHLQDAYLIGSAALAIILFDGGLHTKGRVFRIALGPASALATIGVVVTAAITAGAAMLFLHLDWKNAGLIGSIVSSTDAAAVFLLLHQGGRDISPRVAATLEVEAGFNDPVSVFLTVSFVAILSGIGTRSDGALALFLLRQAGLGLLVGGIGGLALVQLVNRMRMNGGLYPILVMTGAIGLFAGTQMIEGSGYLAAYIAGVICGNNRLRSSQMIVRFHEAMAWLAQLILFIMLGLMVVPHRLLPDAVGSFGVAAVLILLARPIAVWLCLTPFRFTIQERVFIAWVGLRGAVPIFLALIPAMAGVAMSTTYFHVAFLTVLVSLVCQGWTIARAARWLRLELPGEPTNGEFLDLDLRGDHAQGIAAWRVSPFSPALDRPFDQLPIPSSARVIAVLRDGVVMDRAQLDHLAPDDLILALAPDETIAAANFLFAEPAATEQFSTLGDFALSGSVPMATLADLYGLPSTITERDMSVGSYMRHRLARRPVVGDRIHLGLADLIVRRIQADAIIEIGVALDPERIPLDGFSIRKRFARIAAAPLRAFRRSRPTE